MTTRTHTNAEGSSVLPADETVNLDQLAAGLRKLDELDRPRFKRSWTYYKNPLQLVAQATPEINASDRPYRQGQEWGLPARITGYEPAWVDGLPRKLDEISRKEVVIENDIAWRVDAMVDYLFGKPITITSLATNPARRLVLTDLAWAVLEANGGTTFLQQLALLGAVFGFVDVVVKLDVVGALALRDEMWAGLDTLLEGNKPREARYREPAQAAMGRAAGDAPLSDVSAEAPGESTPGSDATATAAEGTADGQSTHAADDLEPTDTGPGKTPDGRLIERLARLVRFEIVHPSRAVPLGPLPREGEMPAAYAQVIDNAPTLSAPATRSPRRRWWQWAAGMSRLRDDEEIQPQASRLVELLTPTHWYRLSGTDVISRGDISLGRVPVVHIQNVAVPFEYAGKSDVEPLIPLQDELNTRLSDRAYRITMTSFKMFLGKGLDNFLSAPVGPGRMWSTDNTEAEVDEFGGDDRCPSEEQHISDLRDAIDKASGVPPVAAGAIKDRLGQLSSAAALRVTMASLMAKTERKRVTYGRGIQQLCGLALAWLDSAGLVKTDESERGFEINWSSIIPDSSTDKLQEANLKVSLGVPRDVVLRELGY